jgi:hypothetical protein
VQLKGAASKLDACRLGIAMRRGLAMSGQPVLPFGFDNATDTCTTVIGVPRIEEIKS